MQSTRTCTVEGCERPYRCKGMCDLHYGRMRSTGSTDLLPREPRPRKSPSGCSFEGCSRRAHARSYCNGHYRQWKCGIPLHELASANRGLTTVQRIDAYSATEGDCQVWTGYRDALGYGRITLTEDGGKRTRLVHRLNFTIRVGPIPRGMDIDHMCHNPSCIKPSHLQVVDRRRNAENRAGAQRNSRSGVRGVTWHRYTNSWRAQVHSNGKYYYVGCFASVAEAEAAVIAKRNELMSNNLVDRGVQLQ